MVQERNLAWCRSLHTSPSRSKVCFSFFNELLQLGLAVLRLPLCGAELGLVGASTRAVCDGAVRKELRCAIQSCTPGEPLWVGRRDLYGYFSFAFGLACVLRYFYLLTVNLRCVAGGVWRSATVGSFFCFPGAYIMARIFEIAFCRLVFTVRAGKGANRFLRCVRYINLHLCV